MDYRVVKKCRICKSSRLKKYLDLGSQPVPNKLENPAKCYPLQVLYCQDCSLSQLSIVVKPEIMYMDYPYHSSVSKTFQKHCYELAIKLKKFKTKNNPPSCMDIASNDGCLMEQFRKVGFIVRGYEPCKELARIANDKMLLTINRFFSLESSKDTRCWSGEDFITATNVFAHVDDIHDFLEACKIQMEANRRGIVVVEVPYLQNLIHGNQFDTIYHEHLSYFLLKPLVRLFKECGVPIFKVERIPIHGGSIRIYASMHNYKVSDSIRNMLEDERIKGFYRFDTYKKFKDKVENVKKCFKFLLEHSSLMGHSVAGYGASAKGISLLNYCGINQHELRYIVDDTIAKQGKFTPGSEIPILSKFFKPDYIVLLAWNFADELMEKTKHLGAKYVIPIPNVRVI